MSRSRRCACSGTTRGCEPRSCRCHNYLAAGRAWGCGGPEDGRGCVGVGNWVQYRVERVGPVANLVAGASVRLPGAQWRGGQDARHNLYPVLSTYGERRPGLRRAKVRTGFLDPLSNPPETRIELGAAGSARMAATVTPAPRPCAMASFGGHSWATDASVVRGPRRPDQRAADYIGSQLWRVGGTSAAASLSNVARSSATPRAEESRAHRRCPAVGAATAAAGQIQTVSASAAAMPTCVGGWDDVPGGSSSVAVKQRGVSVHAVREFSPGQCSVPSCDGTLGDQGLDCDSRLLTARSWSQWQRT